MQETREVTGTRKRNGTAADGDGICMEPHPLLDVVRCERLRGHPGRHGASVPASPMNLYMRWDRSRSSRDE
jgi:hypothetical protein